MNWTSWWRKWCQKREVNGEKLLGGQVNECKVEAQHTPTARVLHVLMQPKFYHNLSVHMFGCLCQDIQPSHFPSCCHIYSWFLNQASEFQVDQGSAQFPAFPLQFPVLSLPKTQMKHCIIVDHLVHVSLFFQCFIFLCPSAKTCSFSLHVSLAEGHMHPFGDWHVITHRLNKAGLEKEGLISSDASAPFGFVPRNIVRSHPVAHDTISASDCFFTVLLCLLWRGENCPTHGACLVRLPFLVRFCFDPCFIRARFAAPFSGRRSHSRVTRTNATYVNL